MKLSTSPPPLIAINTAAISAFNNWIHYDQLLLNAIIGSLSPQIISFIASVKTSGQARDILSNMHAKPSRDCIMQLRSSLDQLPEGTQYISNYMVSVKSLVDELHLLNCSYDADEVTPNVLNGLGDCWDCILKICFLCI
ncbi:hypothetical protein C2S53_017540 [Perilla frutescens var. hirtella]|uniref:Uncharacterized protein n=1 Tax=Perilla frutescens var. hirtella TaxID=608512 RepID=A0AAD4J9Z6_PERFH|nr:hypothetical protein C2S53_017540 [Perilla frutescens var. hirtella]